MTGSKQGVSLAELERIVLAAAASVPETADVAEVSLETRPGSLPGRRGHDPVPPVEWYIARFVRRPERTPIGDEAVATALAEIVENLSRSYEVVAGAEPSPTIQAGSNQRSAGPS